MHSAQVDICNAYNQSISQDERDVTAEKEVESIKAKFGTDFRPAPKWYKWTNETRRSAYFVSRLSLNYLALRIKKWGVSDMRTHTHASYRPPPLHPLNLLSSPLSGSLFSTLSLVNVFLLSLVYWDTQLLLSSKCLYSSLLKRSDFRLFWHLYKETRVHQ